MGGNYPCLNFFPYIGFVIFMVIVFAVLDAIASATLPEKIGKQFRLGLGFLYSAIGLIAFINLVATKTGLRKCEKYIQFWPIKKYKLDNNGNRVFKS